MQGINRLNVLQAVPVMDPTLTEFQGRREGAMRIAKSANGDILYKSFRLLKE